MDKIYIVIKKYNNINQDIDISKAFYSFNQALDFVRNENERLKSSSEDDIYVEHICEFYELYNNTMNYTLSILSTDLDNG